MRSKIVLLLTATTLLVCSAQAMKKIQMTFKESYVIPKEILNKFDFLSKESENSENFGLSTLIEKTRPHTTKKEFTDHMKLTTREKQSDINEFTCEEFITHTQLANILINNALLPLLKKRLETDTQYKNNPTDKEFISHVTIASILHNRAVLVLLGKHLQSVIEGCGKEYLLHGTGSLKTFLKALPLAFCNQALHGLPIPPLKILKGHKEVVYSIAKMNDDQVVSGSNDKTLKLWDIKTGKCLKTLTGHNGPVLSVAKINDDQIVSGSLDKTLKLWDLKTGKCLKTLIGHESSVFSIAKINDSRVISGSTTQSHYIKTLKLWDLETGKCLKTLTGSRGSGYSVAKMNDNQVISGSCDKTLNLWDLITGECLKTLTGHEQVVSSVVKMSDDQVISGSLDNTLKLWDLKTGNCLKTLTGHNRSVRAVAKMNDSQVVSGSDDGILKLWDLETGNCLKTLMGKLENKSIRSIAKINDTQIISGSGSDNLLKLWNLNSNWLQDLSFEQALFLKILQPCGNRNSLDHPFNNSHATEIFLKLPKDKQRCAIENDLV